VCVSARTKAYRLKNKEKIKKQRAAKYTIHKDEINAKNRQLYKNDAEYRERLRIHNKQYRDANPEKVKEQRKAYQAKHKDRLSAISQQYRDTHKPELREYFKKHHAKNRVRLNAKSKARYEIYKNDNEYKQAQKDYVLKHKEKTKIYQDKYHKDVSDMLTDGYVTKHLKLLKIPNPSPGEITMCRAHLKYKRLCKEKGIKLPVANKSGLFYNGVKL